jgi:hypothetical protein
MLLVGTVAGVALLVFHGRREAAQQARALATAQGQSLGLKKLRDQHRTLETKQVPPEELARLRSTEEAAQALYARMLTLRQQDDGAEGIAGRQPVPAASWTYAGRSSPTAAFESVLWTASHGDVAPEVLSRAQSLFARLPPESQQEYGSPQKVIATLLAGNFPKDASSMALLAETRNDQGSVLVARVSHADGEARLNAFQFADTAAGWQLMVPANIMDGYEKSLAGGPPTPESPGH